MILFFGVRRFGAVMRHRGTSVATHFVHVMWLPLIPLGGVDVVQTEFGEQEHGRKLSVRSVVAGYMRFWPVVAALALTASWAPAWWCLLRWSCAGQAMVVFAVLWLTGWLVGIYTPSRERARRDALLGEPSAPSTF